MNKTLLYAIAGVVVVLGAIGLYMTGGPVGNMATQNGQETSLKELLASQNPQKCIFNHETDISDSSGEVVVSGGKMRGDFNSLAAGQTVKTHMIVDSGTAYVWTDTMAQGFKMSVDAMNTSSTDTNQNLDINQRLNYSCTPWTPDASVFTLPTGITFTDMTALMNSAMPQETASGSAAGGAGTGSLQAQCGMCDTITDASAKAQCRTALQCK